MDSGPLAAILLLVLILLNGFLALSEISIVSARKGLLQSRAATGSKRDQTALALARSPGNFLSTIQVGITLVGILTGALGGATIAEDLAARISTLGVSAATSELISVILVVIATTYLSLILGELAPKQIGLIHSERVAAAVAPTINTLSWIARPVVWVLSKSTGVVMRLLGIRPSTEPVVTEEEIKILIDQGTESGVFEKVEDAIVDQVFRMSDLKTLSVTIPRHEITWLDLN
ncbi:MAG: CNNM domain-containing protein, partial [Anaerolineaceae bacterium]